MKAADPSLIIEKINQIEKENKLATKERELNERVKKLEDIEKKRKNTIAWLALIVAILGTILLPVLTPYIEHKLYDKEIASFDVDLPSHYVSFNSTQVKIPFAITNYGTVPVKMYSKYMYRNSEKTEIKLFDSQDDEVPFKTVYMEGEGIYGFIYLDNTNKDKENISFCIEYYPAGKFTKYYKNAKGICTPFYFFTWK